MRNLSLTAEQHALLLATLRGHLEVNGEVLDDAAKTAMSELIATVDDAGGDEAGEDEAGEG